MMPSSLVRGLEGGERFRVRHRLVFESPPLLVVRVLGSGTGIVESRGDRMRLGDLPSSFWST